MAFHVRKLYFAQFQRNHNLFLDFTVDDDIDGIPLDKVDNLTGGFIPSKWETVDPDQIEAQAITTSKWDTLEPIVPEPPAISAISDDSFDSVDYSESNRDFDEEKRNRLREVELKTVQYQDELESGQRNLKSGWTIQQQIEHYRRKLMKKTYKEIQQESPISSTGKDSRSQTSLKRSPSPLEMSLKKAKKSKRSPSPPYNRSSARRKSRSPVYAKKLTRDSVTPPSKYDSPPRRYKYSLIQCNFYSPFLFFNILFLII